MSEAYSSEGYIEHPGDAIFPGVLAPSPEIDIPLDIRLTFTDSFDRHPFWLHAQQIADNIGTSDNNVQRIATFLGIPRETRQLEGGELNVFPPYTQAVVREEIVWRQTYRSLPQHIRLRTIVEQGGRSYGWTRKTIDELHIRPTRSDEDNGRIIELYPKGVLKVLRKINMAVPMDDGWYTLKHLVDYTGADREWIARRLTDATRRRSSLTGKILNYYPPESVHNLLEQIAARPEFGADWLTVNAITSMIGRPANGRWVNKQLAPFVNLAVEKQDDHGVTRLHYAPQIVELLRAESERQLALPERGDYLSLKQVIRTIGHMQPWVETRFLALGIQPEERRDRLGRLRLYYSPSVLFALKDYEEMEARNAKSTDEQLLESVLCIGSLKSQIKLQGRRIRIMSKQVEGADSPELAEATIVRDGLKISLKDQRNRYYRLITKADELPPFISGIKKPQTS